MELIFHKSEKYINEGDNASAVDHFKSASELNSFNNVSKELPDKEIINKLEKEAVLTSVKNLTTFPFIQKAISEGSLSIHGLWHNIGTGELMYYDSESNDFILV